MRSAYVAVDDCSDTSEAGRVRRTDEDDMSIVRTYCERCGDVRVSPDAVELILNPRDSTAATCRIVCPSCHERIIKPANESLVALLKAVGVRVTEWETPRDRLSTPELPPLTFEDLTQFRSILDSHDDLLSHFE